MFFESLETATTRNEEVLLEAITESQKPLKRKKIESMILSTFKTLDPTGLNVEKFKETIGSLSNDDFAKLIKSFKSRKDFVTFEATAYENEPSLDLIEKAAKELSLPLDEYIYFRDKKLSNGEYSRGRSKCPTGYIHLRRMQQILSKKNSFTANIDQRSQLTGQVANDSKIARLSDNETSALLVMGSTHMLKELLGSRADNKGEKAALYQSISKYGYATLSDITDKDTVLEGESNAKDNVVLNTIDVMFLGAGIKTDLISENYVLDKKKLDKK
jgi:hypothetical protein